MSAGLQYPADENVQHGGPGHQPQGPGMLDGHGQADACCGQRQRLSEEGAPIFMRPCNPGEPGSGAGTAPPRNTSTTKRNVKQIARMRTSSMSDTPCVKLDY